MGAWVYLEINTGKKMHPVVVMSGVSAGDNRELWEGKKAKDVAPLIAQIISEIDSGQRRDVMNAFYLACLDHPECTISFNG